MRLLFGVTVGISLRWHRHLYPLLIERGCEVHVVCSPSPELVALGRIPGVTVHEITMQRRPAPLRDLVALVRLVRLIRSVRPDVTMFSTPKAALLGGLAARFCRVPRRIYELFGLRLETARGAGRWVLGVFERLTMRVATDVLAVGASLRARATMLGAVPAGVTIDVLGMGATDGIDLAHFRPDRPPLRLDGIDSASPTVGYVGRLSKDKGLWDFADALGMLRERGVPVQALVVGAIDDPSGEIGIARLREHGIPVALPGWVDDAAPYYSAMDVFCAPSKREGLGGVTMEAMASRLPIVATDCTGQTDLIRDGDTGWLVPVGDVAALADSLQAALSDPAEGRRRAARAHAFITEHFSTQRVRGDLVRYLIGPQE